MFEFLQDLRKSEVEKRQEALTAYLDGVLTPAERKRFERLLASDEALRASLAEQRLIKASLRRLPRMRAPRNFTLDPARYGRPAPSASERLYPIIRVATAVVAIMFVLLVVIDLSPLGGLQGGAQPLAETIQSEAEVAAAPAAAEAPAIEAPAQPAAADEAAIEVTRIVEEEALEMAAEEPAAEQPAPAEMPAEEGAATEEAAEAAAAEVAQEAIEGEAPLVGPEEVTGGGGLPPAETPLAMLAAPTVEGAAAATEGQAVEDRAVTGSSQPLKATAEAEAPLAAGDAALTEEAASQPAPSPVPRAVPTVGAEAAAGEQGPVQEAAGTGLSMAVVVTIGLGLLLVVLIMATLLLRRRTR
jgi:hypothetical protein